MFSQNQRFFINGGFKIVLMGGLICLPSSVVWGQSGGATVPGSTILTPPVIPVPNPPAAVGFVPAGGSANFLLDTDDVISVQVANHPEMSSSELQVGSSGKVALAVVGPLSVRGKTLAQAQQLIAQAYARELKNPRVSVTLARPRPRQVMMLGVVNTTGPITMNPGWRVSEALAAAGNLKEDPAYVHATLVRGRMAPMALKLSEILATPSSQANVKLAPNDVLNFAAIAPMRVTVTGAVTKPGVVPLRGQPRVLDAILGAGGTQLRPDQTRLTLMRGGKTTSLNVPAIVQGTSDEDNISLKDGDLLSFAAIQMKVSVISLDNLVKNTGSFELTGTTTVLRALQTAGGLAVPPEKVVVAIRRGEETIPVDLQKAVVDPTADLPLEDNDLVLVNWPEGPRVRLIGGITTAGPYNFKTGTTVLDAIVQAGGLSSKPADVSINVLRTMADGRQINLDVDAVKLFQLRDLGQNVLLKDNDLIFVNTVTKDRTVFVSGDVNLPNAYQIVEGEGLTELLLRAGGSLPTAALTRITVTRRDGTTQTIDYSAIKNGQNPQLNLVLQQGDVVNVPRNPNQVLVMKAVNKPGYVAVPENSQLTLNDALLAAGGPVSNAKTKQIAVIRPDLTKKVAEVRVVSLDDVQRGNIAALNLILQPNDIIYVPETTVSKSALSQIGPLLGIATFFK